MTVTAQKRTENAQVVPISMDVLSNDKLTEMNVSDINDWIKLLPSVTTSSSQGSYQPGFGQISMRGVESGSNGNHSGPSPSVGIYLDEEPITTIVGSIDPHIYDIQRIEALAGPQGTLYGASSESGTIRIITNKPDTTAFSASVSTEVNTVDHGNTGYLTEGYVNLPLTESDGAACRRLEQAGRGLHRQRVGHAHVSDVGRHDQQCGYGAQGLQLRRHARFARRAEDRPQRRLVDHAVDRRAERARQRHQCIRSEVGDLKLTHFFPEKFEDRWIQSALTVQGKIGNFDIVYAAAHLNRSDHTDQDYSDYSFWYDTLYGYGAYITDKNGNAIDPSQYIKGVDKYSKTSNELRVSSPQDSRFRFSVGAFAQRQTHDIQQDYLINNLSPDLSVTGWPNTIWLTKQLRTDSDSAIFGEMSFDFTDRLTGTVGARFFHTDDSLKGFFGYAAGYSSSQGEATCFDPHAVQRRTVHRRRQEDHRQRPYRPREPHIQARSRQDDLCDLVGRLPPGRHQSPRNAAAVPARLPHQLRVRLEDRMARQSPALERRAVPGKLEGLPVRRGRRERADRNPQRQPGAYPRLRVEPRTGRRPTT